MKLLLIRHAESEGNIAGVLQGQQEHRLSAQGHNQAQNLGQYLTSPSQWAPTHIYSSPLQRTIQTAQYCQPNNRLPIQVHKGLIEIHNGVLQGLTWEEAQTHHPQLCHALSSSLSWIPIPEAESPETVFIRAGGVMDGILSEHQNGDRLWIFSHGGIMQHLIAQLMGCDRVWGISIPPTGLFEFEINLDLWPLRNHNRYTAHASRVLQFNTTPHLPS